MASGDMRRETSGTVAGARRELKVMAAMKSRRKLTLMAVMELG
jgi:hypothetical protein